MLSCLTDYEPTPYLSYVVWGVVEVRALELAMSENERLSMFRAKQKKGPDGDNGKELKERQSELMMIVRNRLCSDDRPI